MRKVDVVDSERVERARQLTVKPLAFGWKVSGGSKPRTVLPKNARDPQCKCEAKKLRKHSLCKHEIAVLIYLRRWRYKT